MIWVSAHVGTRKIILGVLYRPPDSASDFTDSLNEALEQITLKHPKSILVLCGDFNYPSINWLDYSVSHHNNRAECICFLNLLQLYQLTQLVREPTRGDNTLDLVFTNHPDHASASVLEEISDHKIIHCRFSLPRPDNARISKEILDYARADIPKMNSILTSFAADFRHDFTKRTTNENWCLFRDKLKELEKICVPKFTISNRINDPWFTNECKRYLNRKKRVYRRASRTNAPLDWMKYKEIAALTERKLEEEKQKYYNDTLPKLLKSDPKKFWRTVNPKSSNILPALTTGEARPYR